MKKLLVIVAALVSASVCANAMTPQQRADKVKMLLIQRVTQDGWALTSESPSLLTFAKAGSPWDTVMLNLLASGSMGSDAVTYLTFTVIPVTGTWTSFQARMGIQNQNVFGRPGVIGFNRNNKKAMAYVESVQAWVRARMPDGKPPR
jgi:hypothetical protein